MLCATSSDAICCGDRLTLPVMSDGHFVACRHASSMTHAPTSFAKPMSSATPRNCAGGSSPRVGWRQRMRHSKPVYRIFRRLGAPPPSAAYRPRKCSAHCGRRSCPRTSRDQPASAIRLRRHRFPRRWQRRRMLRSGRAGPPGKKALAIPLLIAPQGRSLWRGPEHPARRPQIHRPRAGRRGASREPSS